MSSNNIGQVKVSSEKSPIEVREVFIHQNPHLDEIFAYFLLRQYGEKEFVGISTAVIRFVEEGISGSDEEYDKDGVLPIGVGKGRFDEHRSTDERIPGECASTLVAAYLGVDANPELKRILPEVLYFDSHSGCNATKLAELVKVAHRTNKNEYDVLEWVMTAISAMVRQEKYRYAKAQGEKSLVEILRESIAKGLYTEDERVRQHMFNQAHQSERNKEDGQIPSVTEIAFIVSAMYRQGYTEDAITDWLVVPLDQMVLDQLAFWKEVDSLKHRPMSTIQAMVNGKEKEFKLMLCNSDSPLAQKAARYIGAEVIVLRNSAGNAQIFLDTRTGANLSQAVRMIRWLELPIGKKYSVDWNGLAKPGDHPDVGNWYYFKKGEMFFNGSKTVSASPTQLGNQALVDVMKFAFHPRGIWVWKSRVGYVEPRVQKQGVSPAITEGEKRQMESAAEDLKALESDLSDTSPESQA